MRVKYIGSFGCADFKEARFVSSAKGCHKRGCGFSASNPHCFLLLNQDRPYSQPAYFFFPTFILFFNKYTEEQGKLRMVSTCWSLYNYCKKIFRSWGDLFCICDLKSLVETMYLVSTQGLRAFNFSIWLAPNFCRPFSGDITNLFQTKKIVLRF